MTEAIPATQMLPFLARINNRRAGFTGEHQTFSPAGEMKHVVRESPLLHCQFRFTHEDFSFKVRSYFI